MKLKKNHTCGCFIVCFVFMKKTYECGNYLGGNINHNNKNNKTK